MQAVATEEALISSRSIKTKDHKMLHISDVDVRWLLLVIFQSVCGWKMRLVVIR